MRNLFIAIVTLFSFAVGAQNHEPVLYRFHYDADFKSYEEDDFFRHDLFFLDVGRSMSKFYPLYKEMSENIADSLTTVGADIGELFALTGQHPRPKAFWKVFKNYPENGSTTVTDFLTKNFIYTEPTEVPEWTFLAQDTFMLEHPCQQATCDYHGRQWTVWFATDLPISNGPWKLSGLPGIILKAWEAEGKISFTCTRIKDIGGRLTIKLPSLNKFLKCTRTELMELKRRDAKDPLAFERSMGFPGVAYDASGKPMKYKPRTPVLLDK